MKRVLLSLLFATLAGALVFGAAANLPVSSQKLGSGGGAVSSCDPTSGVTTTFGLVSGDASMVESVTVTGIDAGCDGGTVHVSVRDGGSSLATGSGGYTDSVDSGSKTVTLSGPADANLIDEVVVTIVGGA